MTEHEPLTEEELTFLDNLVVYSIHPRVPMRAVAEIRRLRADNAKLRATNQQRIRRKRKFR